MKRRKFLQGLLAAPAAAIAGTVLAKVPRDPEEHKTLPGRHPEANEVLMGHRGANKTPPAVTTDEGLTKAMEKFWAEASKIEKPDVELVSQRAHEAIKVQSYQGCPLEWGAGYDEHFFVSGKGDRLPAAEYEALPEVPCHVVRKGNHDITPEELVQYGTNVLNAYLETKPI